MFAQTHVTSAQFVTMFIFDNWNKGCASIFGNFTLKTYKIEDILIHVADNITYINLTFIIQMTPELFKYIFLLNLG